MFAIRDDSTYEELCYEIRYMFIGLGSSTFQTKYVMPGIDYYVICNDEEMKFMFVFVPIFGANYVDTMVTSTGVTSYESSIEIPIAEREVEPLLEYEAQEITGHEVFLSDEWRTAINHVNQCFPGGAITLLCIYN